MFSGHFPEPSANRPAHSCENKYREADSVPQKIQIRKNRGSVTVNQIMVKLAELCLGKWYYEAAMIFRNSLLLSTLLTNLESWYSCTAKDIIDLEKIVKYYWGEKWMRQPKHQLRLYTWNWEPRLLSSSHDKETHVPEPHATWWRRTRTRCCTEIDNPGKGDWVHLMRQDIQDLNPNQMFENIARMLNIKWKPSSEKLSRKKKEAFKYLSDIQAGHSKTRNLRYSGLQLQPYLSI